MYNNEIQSLIDRADSTLPLLMELLTIPKQAIPSLLRAIPDGLGNYKLGTSGRILGLAHIDTVFDSRMPRPVDSGHIIISPALDDRIGIYVLLALRELMPMIDIVLTDNEESCDSTAQAIPENPDYIAMMEIDRGGFADNALYQYLNDPIWSAYTESITGLKAVSGSYSDIADSETGIAGVNLAAGYNLAHSLECYVLKDDILKVYRNALRFASTILLESKPFRFDNVRYPSGRSAMWESDHIYSGELTGRVWECRNCGMEYDPEINVECPRCGAFQYSRESLEYESPANKTTAEDPVCMIPHTWDKPKLKKCKKGKRYTSSAYAWIHSDKKRENRKR